MKHIRTSRLLGALLVATAATGLTTVQLDHFVGSAHAAKGGTKGKPVKGTDPAPTPTDPAPTEPAPTEPAPTEPTPTPTEPAPAPAPSSATLLLNAGQDVSETGGNDLLAARTLFRSASYPESNGGLETTSALLARIGNTYSRTINAEDGSRVDSAGTFYPSDRLTWNLPWIKRYGYNAHVIVGQRQPAFIGTGSASQWTSAQWAAYEDYAYKLVRWVSVQFDNTGFPETYFEVGNEIDITQDTRDLWTLANPSIPQGDDTRYQHYMRIFPVWARAVDRVARENSGRSIKIAGPALGGQSLFLTNSFWHERFIRDVANGGMRLDAVTHHFYGDILNGWSNVPGSALKTQLQRIRQALNGSGRGNTPIHISEYGPSESSDSFHGRINYSHVSAAWAAMFVQEALGGTATGGSYLLVRDNFGGDATGVPGITSFSHFYGGVDYPKAALNAFHAVTMLPGTRKAVTTSSTQPNVRGLAGANSTSAGLLAYNFNFRFSDNVDLTTDQTVVPGFSGLAFNGGATVERHLIDRNTSNVARYLDAGQTPDLGGSSLTRVEQCNATVDQGNLVLPARVLGPSAVSLWTVRSGATSGAPTCQ